MKKVLLIICVLLLQHSSYTQEKKDSSFVWVKKEDFKKYLENEKVKLKEKFLKDDAKLDGQLMLISAFKDSVKIIK